MLIKANAKINWALDVTGTRNDGYHLLDMVMQKIELSDLIEILPDEKLSLTVKGNSALSSGNDNLIMRAAHALDTVGKRTASICLTKNIPTGAGLGGGSADAAAVLKALNTYWNLGLSAARLSEIGLGLGADIPYCLTDLPARVQGIGEKVISFSVPRSLPVIIAMPEVHLATKDVYASWNISPQVHPPISKIVNQLESGDLPDTSGETINSLYPAVASLSPDTIRLKQMLKKTLASAVEMTGSGSAVYAAFKNDEDAKKAYDFIKDKVAYCVLTHTCI